MINLNINKSYLIILSLKYSLFISNFIFNDLWLLMITSSNKEYFRNNFIFYLRLEKKNIN